MAEDRGEAPKGLSEGTKSSAGKWPEYLKEHWQAIREQLLSGSYKPQPEIPKPDGGIRKLVWTWTSRSFSTGSRTTN
jgi:RNA-directed DNA polymerase